MTRTIEDAGGPVTFRLFEPEHPRAQERLDRMEQRYRKLAKRLKCHFRQIPTLGTDLPGPFHPAFKVERNADGNVTGIDATGLRDYPPDIHIVAPENHGGIKVLAACGEIVVVPGGPIVSYDDRAQGTCARCRQATGL